MLIKFQKILFKYLKNMKTCAPTGAAGIGCKCYRVQLVIGSTVFHLFTDPRNVYFSIILVMFNSFVL